MAPDHPDVAETLEKYAALLHKIGRGAAAGKLEARARAMNNRYIETMAEHRTPLPDFPTMYGFSAPLMQASANSGNTDFQILLYGQAAALNRELPAAELMARLTEEAQSILKPRE